MKKLPFILLWIVFPFFAQNITNPDLAHEVDQQVWEPFKASYANGDAITFNNLHTEGILRISKNGIQKGEEYKASNTKWFSKSNRRPRTIDFVFEHRIYSKNTAYEIGYYKIVYNGEEEKASYARFTVLLKKQNGKWRIAQDWDTHEINGREVTAEDFNKLQQ